MKRYNKNPKYRSTWTKVDKRLPSDTGYTYDYIVSLEKWCWDLPSKGRFYEWGNIWYFEYPEDALAFKLTWQ